MSLQNNWIASKSPECLLIIILNFRIPTVNIFTGSESSHSTFWKAIRQNIQL